MSRGHWHGSKYYVGLHYDLHAGPDDADLGQRAGENELLPMLKLANVDFVQTDTKGHPGYLSWISNLSESTMPEKMTKDALKQWRAATKKLGQPLSCHYSGVWDKAAGKKHPDWCVVPSPKAIEEKKKEIQNAAAPAGDRMCPRGEYLDKLMLPQMKELIDRYQINGFWVDGDIWAVDPCYCDKCRAAFTQQTGIQTPPDDKDGSHWQEWYNFTMDSFKEYVVRYTKFVHDYKPGVLVCSNWLQTFWDPGEPKIDTDWISGDNANIWGLDSSRIEARFISTREKPWDIMIWGFYSYRWGDPTSPWTFKPADMIKQEAVSAIAFGGGTQVYDNGGGPRDGRLVPWRIKRIAEVVKFVKSRRTLSQATETIPQIAVLHSEHHLRSSIGKSTHIGSLDLNPVRGAVYALLQCQYSVDILDEWALLPKIGQYPIIIAPERHAMSDGMVAALKAYVNDGGYLLISGADSFDRFGEEFLGASSSGIDEKKQYHVSVRNEAFPVYSEKWRLLTATTGKAIGTLGTTSLLDDKLIGHPTAIINKVGKGTVCYVPFNVFKDHETNRYPMTPWFIGDLIKKLAGKLDIEVKGPSCVDVVLRQKGTRKLVHFLNRSSGIPNTPQNGIIDEIPLVGPITVTMKLDKKPKTVALAFEKGEITSKYAAGKLVITVPVVHIHAAVVIETV